MSLIEQINEMPEPERVAFLAEARMLIESREEVASGRQQFDSAWNAYKACCADPQSTYEQRSEALRAVRLFQEPQQQEEKP